MAERPNILFILTEQQRGDCLGCEGHPVLLTPNMDNIAAKGVRFSRFYSACPTCIAARRTILSGQSPVTHGMVGYKDGVEWNPPATLPGVLRDNGYQTMWVGRSIHQYPQRKRFGFDEMEISSSNDGDYEEWLRQNAPPGNGGWFGGGVMHNDWTARPWYLDEHLHQTNWTVDRALRFLRRRDPSCPFFLCVSFIASHPPLQPPAFYLERYLRTGVPDRVLGDWAVQPQAAREADLVSPNQVDLHGEALLSARAAYYGLINHIDDQLRRIINPINGLTPDNTVILLTSDHGEMLGDHYLWRKSVAYEPSARVPFLIAAPPSFGLTGNTVVEQPATHADIMPTLLEMADIPIPDSVDGRSLAALARGDKCAWREYVHIEHAPLHHALTSGREKYLWKVKDGTEQLFDLSADPHECHDLAADSANEPGLKVWRERLIKLLKDRPEGFSDGNRLIAGRTYSAALPHAGVAHQFSHRQFAV